MHTRHTAGAVGDAGDRHRAHEGREVPRAAAPMGVSAREGAGRAGIREAALNPTARQGIEATTIEQITAAADVGKGTFFNHYRSKEAVLAADYHVAFHGLLADLERSGATSFAGRVRELYAALFESVRDRRSFVTAVLRESLVDSQVRRLEDQAGPRLRELLRGFVLAGQRAGEVRESLDASLVASMMMEMWTATLFRWAASGDDFPLDVELGHRLD